MESRSAGWGGLSLLSAAAFSLLRGYSSKLPFGENDFDLYLFGLMIFSIGLAAGAIFLIAVGFVTGIVDLMCSSPRSVPAIGLAGSIVAGAVLVWSFLPPD